MGVINSNFLDINERVEEMKKDIQALDKGKAEAKSLDEFKVIKKSVEKLE